MGWVFNATCQLLYTREWHGTHCVVRWMGSRAGLDGCGISRLPLGFDPRTVQTVASCYTDYGIPTHGIHNNANEICFSLSRVEQIEQAAWLNITWQGQYILSQSSFKCRPDLSWYTAPLGWEITKWRHCERQIRVSVFGTKSNYCPSSGSEMRLWRRWQYASPKRRKLLTMRYLRWLQRFRRRFKPFGNACYAMTTPRPSRQKYYSPPKRR